MIIFWIISFLAEKFSRQVSNVVGKRHLYCGGSDGGKLFIWNWIFKRKGSEAQPRSHCFAKTLARSRINQLHVTPLVTDWLWGWFCCQYFLREIQVRDVLKTCFGLCHLEVFRSCGFCPFMFTENSRRSISELLMFSDHSFILQMFSTLYCSLILVCCWLQWKSQWGGKARGVKEGKELCSTYSPITPPRWVEQPPRSTPQVRERVNGIVGEVASFRNNWSELVAIFNTCSSSFWHSHCNQSKAILFSEKSYKYMSYALHPRQHCRLSICWFDWIWQIRNKSK